MVAACSPGGFQLVAALGTLTEMNWVEREGLLLYLVYFPARLPPRGDAIFEMHVLIQQGCILVIFPFSALLFSAARGLLGLGQADQRPGVLGPQSRRRIFRRPPSCAASEGKAHAREREEVWQVAGSPRPRDVGLTLAEKSRVNHRCPCWLMGVNIGRKSKVWSKQKSDNKSYFGL